MFTMICGFTFTSITILVTRLPDPISIGAQLTILFLMILFDLFLDIFLSLLLEGIRHCRYVPPLTRFVAFRNHLVFLGTSLWGLSVPMMFLFWNLPYLAVAGVIIWALFLSIGTLTAWVPFLKYRKNLHVE